MARYPSYQPTHIPWLPEIPVGWEVRRLKSLFTQRSETYTPDEKLIVLSLIKDVGVIPYEEKGNIGNKSKEDISTYNVARKGDIVLNSMNIIIGSVDITHYDGYISPAYYAITAKPNVSTRYYNYIFHLKAIQKHMRCLAKGIMEIRLRISITNLFGLYLPVPPLPEQERIVAYLDKQTAKVDTLIKAKTEQMALLKELRERTIADAVTRGKVFFSQTQDSVSLTHEMSPTGIFWQPMMPQKWVVRKLKYVLTKLNRVRQDAAELLVCTNKGTVVRRGDSKMGLVSDDVSIYQGVMKGDLLIHGMDTWHGAIAISEEEGMCTPVVHVCDSAQNKKFVALYLRNMARGRVFKLISNGVRQNTSDFRSWEKVAALPIILPSLSEQERIVAYLDKQTAKIDKAVALLASGIEHLKAYRERLIADVVTGQLKVE